MMNRKTRKLSKIPDAVKEEIQPYFAARNVFVAEDTRKLHKLEDDTAQYICSDLTVSTPIVVETKELPRFLKLLTGQSILCIFFCSHVGVIWMLISMSTTLNILVGFWRYIERISCNPCCQLATFVSLRHCCKLYLANLFFTSFLK